jgi:sulfur relay (sulfurtransferase) complex TusBCD TusD component (DsrE family)
MHYAISTSWGPTDTTRASLPFIFAASALEAGDTVMIMLFHDSVMVAVRGAHEKMVPVGPPPAFAEVLAHENAQVLVCKPCAQARGIGEDALVPRCRFGGMKDFHAHASREDCKVIAF